MVIDLLVVLALMLASCSTAGGPVVTPVEIPGDVRPLPATAQRIAAGQAVRIVLFGDSISEVGRSPKWHGGASSPEHHWGTLLSQRLAEAYPQVTFEIVWLGIGGQNSYEGLGRIDSLWEQRPDLVLVAFGANDCVWHHLEPAQTRRALTELVQRVRQHCEAVVLSTAGSSPTDRRFEHAEQTVAATRQAAAEQGAPFVDLYAAVRRATDEGRAWARYHLGKNNCHPNDRGHEVWADAVFRVLGAALRQP